MNTYNYYLFSKRTFLRLSYRKMGKALGMGGFRYRLIENGYLKPKKKEIDRFSAFFGEDFTPYVDGPGNNPCDLPRKRELRIATWAYELVGKTWLRIFLAVLTVLFACVFASSYIVTDMLDKNLLSFYSENYQSLIRDVQTNGSTRFSLVGDFETPEIHHSYTAENGHPAYVYIYGSYREANCDALEFRGIYRGDYYRNEFTVSGLRIDPDSDKKGIYFYASITIFDISFRTSVGYTYYGPDDCSNSQYLLDLYKERGDYSTLERIFHEADAQAITFIDDLNNLLKDEKYTKTNMTVGEVLKAKTDGYDASMALRLYSISAYAGGLILTGLALFGFLFAMFYGRKKGGKQAFTRSFVAIVDPPEEGKKPLKKDIRFAPFIPETVLEIVGIALVFYGSLRAVGYIAGFFGLGIGLGEFIGAGSATRHMGIFMIGMFLLYIIDFDAYMEDTRIVRLIFQNAIIFICLYNLEVLLMNGLASMSVLGDFADKIPIPNMFGSIACYFLIAYCLFYTPKFTKKKKGLLVLHRLIAILPISWILIAWILYRGNGIWFNLKWSREALFIFNGEKLPFSILAILYLVGYYLIRLFFEKRLGKTNANVFFNSNRFIWIKNIYLSLIILGVGISEFILRNNAIANKLDFGFYWQIVILIPFILFYHPHKGERSAGTDIATTALYMLALIFCYTLVAAAALIGLVLNMI